MVSENTRDFIFKVLVLVAALAVVLPILTACIAIFYFGDGEGIRILDNLTGPILGGLGTVATVGATLLAHMFLGTKAQNGSGTPDIPAPVAVAESSL